MKHTPGPWTIEPRMKTAVNAGKKHVAMVNFYKCGEPDNDVFGDEHTANANLIAAAPDLLEALRLCANVLAGHDMSKSALTRALEKAAAAMTKAIGADQIKGGE